MLTHKKLILLFLFIILAIALILQNKKNNSNKTEHFFNNPKFINAIYGVNINRKENCKSKQTTLTLNKKKDNLINAKLCYTKEEYKPNEKKDFINRIFLEELEKDTFDQNTKLPNEKYITSESDYLGCYQWNKDDFVPFKDTDSVTAGTNFLTLDEAKIKWPNEKIFMSGEIREEIETMPENDLQNNGKKRSIGGKLNNDTFEKLTKTRVADKYCLGRRDLKPDYRVENYLGGVGTVAVYKNGTPVKDEYKPKLFMRKNLISQSEGCENNVSLNCALEFKKHVLAEFNFSNLFTVDNASNFDSVGAKLKGITLTSSNDIYGTFNKDTFDNDESYKKQQQKRLLFLDYSGNENHMILDYNYLNFLGSFDLRHNFNSIKEYNDWLITKFKTENIDNLFNDNADNYKKFNLHKNNKLILSRCKNIDNSNKAKYLVTNVKDINRLYKNNKNEIYKIFCENADYNKVKFDSMVMRGKHDIWPYMGMIGWWKDGTKYLEEAQSSSGRDVDYSQPPVVKDDFSENGCAKRVEFANIEATFPNLRKDFNLQEFSEKPYVDTYNNNLNKIKNYTKNERVYWLETSNLDKWTDKHHNCNCYGNKHKGYDCDHLKCLNFSYLRDIHHFENPNPLYVSISQTLTTKCFRYFDHNILNVLNLRTQPDISIDNLDDEMKCETSLKFKNSENNKKIKNNNKFFMRGSNDLMQNLTDEYAFIMHLDRKKSEPKNGLYSIDTLKKKYPLLKKKNESYCKNLCGNPILSISANFKNKYDKNEVNNTPSNQAFLWSYMHNYSFNEKKSDGLLYTIPKKVHSIGFAPNKGRLCIGKITVYNKEGIVINTIKNDGTNESQTLERNVPGQDQYNSEDKKNRKNDNISNFELFRKDEYFKYDDPKHIINDFENTIYNDSTNIERSFCFTSNPIQFTKKLFLRGEAENYEIKHSLKVNQADMGYLVGRAKNILKKSKINPNLMGSTQDETFKNIPIKKSPSNNGGLRQVITKMTQYFDTPELDSAEKIQYNQDGTIKYRKFQPREIKSIGKEQIFVSPLNERLKGDAVSTQRGNIMGIKKVKDGKTDWFWEDPPDKKKGRVISNWKDLPVTITEKVNDPEQGFLTLHKESKTHPSGWGQMIFPKLEIPATPNDFYLIKLNTPDYVSRIVVECGLREAVTHHDDINESNQKYFFESTVNSVIKDQFEKTEMFLYDEINTNKILESYQNNKRINKNFNPYDKSIIAINSVKFKTQYNDPEEKENLGFDDKNATIDFYNVDFIEDPHLYNNKKDSKSIAIICENKDTAGSEKILYFKSCLKNDVQTSEKVTIPNDFLKTENTNFNYKIGNLFHNFSDVCLKNFKILGKSFFEDNRKKKKPEGYRNRDEYQPGPMLDKILKNYNKEENDNNKNQYTTVSGLIKNKINNGKKDFTEVNNIIKFLDLKDQSRKYVKVPGDFIKYETDKSRGFSGLHHNYKKNRDTIINDILYAPPIPIIPK